MPSRGPLRVCFFTERQVGIGSVAGVLRRHAENQPDAEVTWCDVTYDRPNGRIERLPLVPGRVKGVLRGIRQTGEGLAGGPYDALFFLTHNPAVFRQGALRRTPSCLWTDVTPVELDRMAWAYEHPVAGSRLVEAAKRAAVTRTFRLAHRCIGWSDWARRSFVDDYGVPRERTAVVPPGIDVGIWSAGDRSARRGPPKIAFVGGHFERKGGKLLLDVFRESFRGRLELLVATRDPIEEEPGVRVVRGLSPGSDGLKNLLSEADAFVLPTLADCHSIASLEAMASGLPVVLTRVGAGAEIVEDGRSGFLIRPNDGRALAFALEELLGNRERACAMGRRGREIVEERFDARSTVASIFEHLRSAVA